MKKIFLIFLVLFFSTTTFCQNFTKEKFATAYDELIRNLIDENWKNAESISKKLYSKIKKDTSFNQEQKVLRYIYIYSIAGLMNEKVITKKKAYAKTKHLVGTEMIMPAHPFISNGYTNCTKIDEEDEHTFLSIVNNANGTQIFSFEYVKIDEGIPDEIKADLEGKMIILSGKLDELSIEGQTLPRFNLKFIEGDFEIIEM